MVVREGTNVTLSCKAKGFPEPYVMWRREDGNEMSIGGENGKHSNMWKIESRKHNLFSLFLCRLCSFVLFHWKSIVNVVDGEVLSITKVSRLHMAAYLCVASNGVPPSISKRVQLKVQCKRNKIHNLNIHEGRFSMDFFIIFDSSSNVIDSKSIGRSICWTRCHSRVQHRSISSFD